jgi:exopolysaccharide biosynthesis operon protein EpsL
VKNRLGAAILVACAAIPPGQALALWDDRVTPFVEEKVTRDSNVFRLSNGVDTEALPGSPSKDDTYRTTSVGLNVDVPVSRQRFQLAYSRNFFRYDQNTQLDLNGYDGRAVWLWQVGNDASGQLSYTESVALASFANIAGVTPDPLKTRQGLFNASYMLTPRWRAQAGVGGFEQTNGDRTREANDISIVSGDASLSYATPANTAIGLGLRAEEGRFPDRVFVPKSEDPAGLGSAFDNAYRQYGADLVLDWTATGISHLNARVGRVSRRNEHLPERDFYGTAVRIAYDWKPTGKLAVNMTVVQDISPYDDIKSSYVFVKGASLRPTLSVTGKIDLSAILEFSHREYLGDPSLAAAGAPSRIDRIRSATATLSYRPIRVLALQMSAQRETRSSTLQFGDYEVNVYTVGARLAF